MTDQTWADLGIDAPYGKSGNQKVKCPRCIHERKNRHDRSLSIHMDDGKFKCHHCGWQGALSRSDWRDNIGLGRRETPKVYTKPDSVTPVISDKIREWFNGRGITDEVLERNHVAGDSRSIRFPYFRDGELVNVKTRWPGKKFSMVAGAERIFYGLDDCLTAATVIIVEGEMDKLAVEVAGHLVCLSVPDGAPSPNTTDYTTKFDFMESGQAIFEQCTAIILAVDNDAPGKKLEDELARRIGREKCFRVTWPEGCKDANDVLVKHGPDALNDCLVDARPYPINGIVMAKEILPDLLSLYRNGSQRGTSTGWPSLDNLYTVQLGQITIVTGMPGSGKSEWLDALMVNIAQDEGWSFAVYSPENFPPARHLQKWMEKLVGKPFGNGPTPKMTEDDITAWIDFCDQHIQFLVPDDPTLDEVLALAKSQLYRRGIKGMVIDPWNEIDHSRPQNMTETEYISQCLSKIRQFCRDNDIHGWVSAHPRMLHKDKVTGEYLVPTPYEIAGSAHWFNKADNCIAIFRDKADDTKPIQVHVQKVRFREIGALGTAYLQYDKVTGEYHDINDWHFAGGRA